MLRLAVFYFPDEKMERTAAFKLGYDAYLGPMKGKKNPYSEDAPEHKEWWEGFNAAQADYAI